MNNFGTLISYEWKKLQKKKILWAVLAAAVVVEILMNCIFLMEYRTLVTTDESGAVIVEEELNGYEKMVIEQAYARALDGRTVDDVLLNEMKESQSGARRQIVTEYQEIFYLVAAAYGWDEEAAMAAEADEFYRVWRWQLEENMRKEPGLTEGEQAYWREKTASIETPFTYRYAFAWQHILGYALATALLAVLLNTVCLSGVFSDEHTRRMDQLILCTQNGKLPVYAAKMLVGGGFSVACTLILYGITFGICFGVYGTEGYDAMLQQSVRTPCPMSMGAAAMLLFGLTLLAGVLVAVFTMLLSELLGSSVAAMSVPVSLTLVNLLVTLPQRWRVVSQIYELFPIRLISQGRFADYRLVPVFGGYLTNIQFAAVFYPALTVLLALVGKRCYRNYQVKGR